MQGADAEEAAGHCVRMQEDIEVLSTAGDADSRAAAKAYGQQASALLRLVMHRLERERGAAVSQRDVERLPAAEDLRARVLSGEAARVAGGALGAAGEKGFMWQQQAFDVESEEVQLRLTAALEKLAQGQTKASTADASGQSGAVAAVSALLDTAIPLYDSALKEMAAALTLLEEAEAAGEEERARGVGLMAAVAISLGEIRIERSVLQAEAVRLLLESF
jgi:hypothetical protein